MEEHSSTAKKPPALATPGPRRTAPPATPSTTTLRASLKAQPRPALSPKNNTVTPRKTSGSRPPPSSVTASATVKRAPPQLVSHAARTAVPVRALGLGGRAGLKPPSTSASDREVPFADADQKTVVRQGRALLSAGALAARATTSTAGSTQGRSIMGSSLAVSTSAARTPLASSTTTLPLPRKPLSPPLTAASRARLALPTPTVRSVSGPTSRIAKSTDLSQTSTGSSSSSSALPSPTLRAKKPSALLGRGAPPVFASPSTVRKPSAPRRSLSLASRSLRPPHSTPAPGSSAIPISVRAAKKESARSDHYGTLTSEEADDELPRKQPLARKALPASGTKREPPVRPPARGTEGPIKNPVLEVAISTSPPEDDLDADVSWETIESRRLSSVNLSSPEPQATPRRPSEPRTDLPSRRALSYVSPASISAAVPSRRNKGRASASLEELLKASLAQGGMRADGPDDWLYDEGASQVMRAEMAGVKTPLRTSRTKDATTPFRVPRVVEVREDPEPEVSEEENPAVVAATQMQEAAERRAEALEASLAARDIELQALRSTHSSLSTDADALRAELALVQRALLLVEGEAAEVRLHFDKGGKGARDAVAVAGRTAGDWMGAVRAEREAVAAQMHTISLLATGLAAWGQAVMA